VSIAVFANHCESHGPFRWLVHCPTTPQLPTSVFPSSASVITSSLDWLLHHFHFTVTFPPSSDAHSHSSSLYPTFKTSRILARDESRITSELTGRGVYIEPSMQSINLRKIPIYRDSGPTICSMKGLSREKGSPNLKEKFPTLLVRAESSPWTAPFFHLSCHKQTDPALQSRFARLGSICIASLDAGVKRNSTFCCATFPTSCNSTMRILYSRCLPIWIRDKWSRSVQVFWGLRRWRWRNVSSCLSGHPKGLSQQRNQEKNRGQHATLFRNSQVAPFISMQKGSDEIRPRRRGASRRGVYIQLLIQLI